MQISFFKKMIWPNCLLFQRSTPSFLRFCRQWNKFICITLIFSVLVDCLSPSSMKTTSKRSSQTSTPAASSSSSSSGSTLSNWTFRCPCVCDFDDFTRKRVLCSNSKITSIPTPLMDKNTQVLVVSGTAEQPLDLTIGRIFQDFDILEEVTISHASVPAIGDSSFWPGKRIRYLNLSHNRISILKETDFIGLSHLLELNLSDNLLSIVPSAAFERLTNLTSLNLSGNKLTRLVPRMFYKLDNLHHLDLSFNPLSDLDAVDVKDSKGSLKRLLLVGCKLTRVHSLVYQTLPNLEELDLRDNLLSSLNPEEFKHLAKLKVLLLDGNQLTSILDHTFYGHNLQSLGLSRNKIKVLSSCSFCNASIRRLDLSRNLIESIEAALFKPLESSLMTLNAEENVHLTHPSRSVYNMLRPLSQLKVLSLSFMNLDDSLPEAIFVTQGKSLRMLDLKGNNIVNMSVKWIDPLEALEELDISSNKMILLTDSFLKRLDDMRTLKAIYMYDNPWSCYRCHIIPLLDWFSNKPAAYESVCSKKDKFCVSCSSPNDLEGRRLDTINEHQIEWCTDPTVQYRIKASEPRVGLVLAILIIIAIIAIIVSIVVMYRRKQGASYYTREDGRGDRRSIYTIEKMLGSSSFDDEGCCPSRCSPAHLMSHINQEHLINHKGPNHHHDSISRHYSSNHTPVRHHSGRGYRVTDYSSPPNNSSCCSMSPPMSPSSQSVSSIPPPPPLPPPDTPYHLRRQSSRLSAETRPKVRL